MLRDTIHDIVAKTLVSLRETGALPMVDLPAFEVERPQSVEHGDYATNAAMKLAAAVRATGEKANPRALAETIAAHLRETVDVVPAYDLIAGVEVAGPGFINFHLKPEWLLRQARIVSDDAAHFGAINIGRGEKVNLEFVSANPTGLPTVGNGRGAFIGDTLGNVMRAAGYDVTKEYYFNDSGLQIEKLGRSMEYYLRLALGEAEPVRPDEGYFGAYYETVAQRILAGDAPSATPTDAINAQPTAADPGVSTATTADQPKPRRRKKASSSATTGAALLALPDDERAAAIGKAAAAIIMGDIRQTMARLHVEFDVFFNEADLTTTGQRDDAIADLAAAGYTEERDGALWAKTTAFGDDKDRVIRRGNGEPTYFASDVAYMRNKYARGFARLILVLGPDHHGYIGRLKAVSGMLGHSVDDIHVLLYQLVTLKVGRDTVKMGKRLGNAITLDELYEDVGADVARFFYLMRANDTPLDFDLELARKQSDENPGLSVQYAHARTAGVFRRARELGVTAAAYERADAAALTNDPPNALTHELALMRQLLRLEEVIERVALGLEPHHLTRYGMDLAEAFHRFYENCPILRTGVEVTPPVRLARLQLLRAAQVGLARTLTLLGMSAPDRMERAEATDAGATGDAGDAGASEQ
ncbi:MAG TPA: arginine--tRNA ligase [Ktedonobacterales bacterium]|nr:arginine--tRNA ligase [Ktedonobacterales bacterium]